MQSGPNRHGSPLIVQPQEEPEGAQASLTAAPFDLLELQIAMVRAYESTYGHSKFLTTGGIEAGLQRLKEEEARKVRAVKNQGQAS